MAIGLWALPWQVGALAATPGASNTEILTLLSLRFTMVIFTHYKPRSDVAILKL